MIFLDEDDAKWECIEVNGGSGPTVGDGDGNSYRRLRLIRADSPWAVPHEIIVSAELDLNNPAIQRWLLRSARKRD